MSRLCSACHVYETPTIEDGLCRACAPLARPARAVRTGDMVQCAHRTLGRAPIQGWSLASMVRQLSCEPGRNELLVDTAIFGAWLRLGDDREPGLRHADGAPIDVESTLAALRGYPVEMPPGPPLSPEKRAAAMALVQREYDGLLGKIQQHHAEMNAASSAQASAANQARGGQFDLSAAAYQMRDAKVSAELEAARKRIAELERKIGSFRDDCVEAEKREDSFSKLFHDAEKRRNELSDQAGALRTELTTVKAELCDALRTIERLQRKRGA